MNRNPEDGGSLEGEFESEEKFRELLTQQVEACGTPEELIEVLNKFQTLPGTGGKFEVGPFLELVRVQSPDQTIFFEGQEREDQVKEYTKLLKNATRAYGIRKKWAEILGVDQLVPADVLSDRPEK